MTNKIGFIITGDEIINGEITNTNSQYMAEKLFELGFTIGNHITTTDHQADIIAGLRFLLNTHKVVIMSGGLGPTTDDRTRFALAEALGTTLEFHQPSWEALSARLQRFQVPVTENNRQQALFPAGSTVIPNDTGTAAGCFLKTAHEQLIFLLPGPPSENRPMFADFVIPTLKSSLQPRTALFYKWRLFGVGEGAIAEKLEQLVAGFPCQTGYRAHRPYVDFKLYVFDHAVAEKLCHPIEELLAPYIVCPVEKTASECLREDLQNRSGFVAIDDQVTGGLLQAALLRPETIGKVGFCGDPISNRPRPHIYLQINGLQAYWQGRTSGTTHLDILVRREGIPNEDILVSKELPLRASYTLGFAVEYIAVEVRKVLHKLHNY